MKAFAKVILLVLAIGLFGWYVSRLGLASVWDVISRIGLWAPVILGPYFIVYIVDTIAWSQTLPPGKLPFFTRFRIRWAGESLNNLIPTANVGGEAAKVVLLRGHGISSHEGAVAAVVSKTAQTVAQLFFIVGASAMFLQLAIDQPRLRLGILFILIGGVAAVGMLFWVQKIGLFRLFLAVLGALPFPVKKFEARKAKLLELDETIFGFYRERRRRFFRAMIIYLCGWTLDTLEIYLVGHLLGVPITWSEALVMEAFTGLAKALGMWVPGSLGVQESGIVLMGKLVGLPDAFVAAYALIRRARELVFVAIGMVLFYRGNKNAALNANSLAETRVQEPLEGKT